MHSSHVSQFFVISSRGDTLLSRDFRGDVVRGTADIFFRKVKEDSELPPVYNLDGLTFISMKRGALYFLVTTNDNASASLCLELLGRIVKVFKDYCGVLSEEAIRYNFVLLYEILDEMIDFGYPQLVSTEILKTFIHNEPVAVEGSTDSTAERLRQLKLKGERKTISSLAVTKPIHTDRGKSQTNEIFLDIIERINVLFSSTGSLQNYTIDGVLQLKSYLSGSPQLSLALNENVVLGRDGGPTYGAVVLDDCNFHQCVNYDSFEHDRALTFVPPDGEFAAMSYRMTGEYTVPFRVAPIVEEYGPEMIEFIVKIRADIPPRNFGSNVVISFPVPKCTQSVSFEHAGGPQPGESAAYKSSERSVVWTVKKFTGGSEHILRSRIALTQRISSAVKREIGPVSMQFEIPMFNVSGLQVRYLHITDRGKSYKPHRWVRYITQASSYVARVGAGSGH